MQGCSPGGNGSNFWTLLLNGDINLSITMTFVSTIAALGMMPLWIFVLGSTLNEGDLVIPYGQLFISLIALIGPISLGMWIRYTVLENHLKCHILQLCERREHKNKDNRHSIDWFVFNMGQVLVKYSC